MPRNELTWSQYWNQLDNHEEAVTLQRDDELENIVEVAQQRLRLSRSDNEIPLRLSQIRKNTEKEKIMQLNTLLKSWRGPVLPESGIITQRFIDGALSCYRQDIPLPYEYAKLIVQKINYHLVHEAKVMNKIKVPEGGRCVVVGDIHGQLDDLLEVLELCGVPSQNNIVIFNGDLVDRGPHGPEVLFTVYAMKLAYKDYVFINRGNHEIRRMNEKYSFLDQVLDTYNFELFDAIVYSFDWLPLSSLIDERVLVLHGGLFEYDDVTIYELANSLEKERGKNPPRRKNTRTREERLVDNLLWSDPEETVDYWEENARGAGILFGELLTKEFNRKNHIEFVVRSHQLVEDGYEVLFDGNLITIFSASNYTGKNDNYGAVLILENIDSTYKNNIEFKKYKVDQNSNMMDECINDTLSQLYVQIFEQRHALASELATLADENGFVTIENCKNCLGNVINLEIDWEVVMPHLIRSEDDSINYSYFLSCFSISVNKDYMNGFHELVTRDICAAISRTCQDPDLENTFKEIDVNGDGRLQYDEFATALKKFDLGLTDGQLYDFISSCDSDRNGIIDIEEFKARFGGAMNREINLKSSSSWISQSIDQLGYEMTDIFNAIEVAFREFDRDGDGQISYREFSGMLRRNLDGNRWNAEERRQIFEYIDSDADGKISYKEFSQAFCEIYNQNWQHSILERIYSAILRGKHQLKKVFRAMDKDGSGLVDVEEFKAALEAMNILMEYPLNENQIYQLYSSISKSEDGFIEYEDFLSNFDITMNN
eukprot:TRINITY_DN5866_c0_g1_i1.p1 TRINITY_DN5866_c0_g1~~TRINITY_DN5866_c0_g1_i1.p1  ORF type:complete len:770 (+),score=155.00 TRINITY_DN5866_c0_g1_i1:30-2339(+)